MAAIKYGEERDRLGRPRVNGDVGGDDGDGHGDGECLFVGVLHLQSCAGIYLVSSSLRGQTDGRTDNAVVIVVLLALVGGGGARRVHALAE